MDDLKEETVGEKTLLETVRDLDKVAWRLNGLIFGEMPMPNGQGINPTPADKITFARNEVLGITQRLRDVADGLGLIGK